MNGAWMYAVGAILLVALLVKCLPDGGHQPCDSRSALPWVACK